jgi:isocitrate dehydrogenase (NAD+)
VHGSAPDIAGKGIANPLALIMSGVMMLNHIHEESIAEKVKSAYDAVLREGKSLTRDLGGTADTNTFADAIISKLK